ncbi:hypothetical protein D3874_00960 [Oleomonas cavernae]|uniref:ATP-binding protein n=1 Tax=Oleomonas cavernae TaxID=2320859 RepID=A0A418WT49_9PROT|nr:hypothetical protein [Oleomonas cavernae]RJF94443.1 hypothetical protein D3874_00960 [Oleomonas cavernae]
MPKSIMRAIVLAAATVMAGGVAYAVEPVKVAQTDKGDALVDGKGMTLYIFDKDSDGKSACYDKCATNWPPLAAGDDAAGAGDYTIVVRDGGAKQWAYKGKPLYTWVKDAKPGDTTGDGVMGVWHIAKP